MASKPKKTSNVKIKKAESPAPKADATKAAKPVAPATPAAAPAGEGAAATKKASAPSRPISYFSAVASEDYRSGWDNIFGSGDKKKKTAKPAKAQAKRAGALPLTITLDAEDFDAATRAALEAVLRSHAKKKRLNFDKLAKNGQVNWQLTCRISST